MTDPADLLDEQVAYYRARAHEYDDWWLQSGQFDRGEEHKRRWWEEIQVLRSALDGFAPAGDVLELAAGTGNWTRALVEHAATVTAVDASAETLAINRAKVAGGRAPVEYVVADLFEWQPSRRHDVVFFSFWLSHVPPRRFEEFWALVDRALAPGGRVFLIDNAHPHDARDRSSGVSERTLSDGSRWRIVKVFHEPDELRRRLLGIGWDLDVRTTDTAFIYGHGGRAAG